MIDAELYELMRTGWKTAYPDTAKPGAVPLAMTAQNLYPGEKLASFGPAAVPDVGVDPPVVAESACLIGGSTAATEGEGDADATQTPPGCTLTAPLPPDCATGYRCVIVFESAVDECDPEWFGCPRTLGIFCLDPVAMALPLREWFVIEDPSWLTNSSDPAAWYLIELPQLPGVSRTCSPATTNAAPGDVLPGMPVGNYAPCSLKDLADLMELCTKADADGVAHLDGYDIQLPVGFCDDISDIVRKVENPGKELGRPTDPQGKSLVMPLTVGVCISLWQYDWDNCLTTRRPDGTYCKGGWSPPKLKGLMCYPVLTWMVMRASLIQSGEMTNGVLVPGHPDDPDNNDCHRQFYMWHGRCYNVNETCRIQTHIRPWKNPDGSDKCVCPSGGGGWHECPCGTPGAVPGGYDPCDPANGYIPPSSEADCDGGGMSVTDPAGTGSGGSVPQPGGGKDRNDIVQPSVVVPRDWGRFPPPPTDCPDHICTLQCTSCHAAFLNGIDDPSMPQGFWSIALAFHACEENLCETTEVRKRTSCKVAGPCSTGFQKSWRTKSCDPGDRTNQHQYCWDPAGTFPGTTSTNFYTSCPVCKGYAEGTWVCRGTPQELTKGPWTAKFDCKPLAAWKAFFEEVNCNRWRDKIYDSCVLKLCTSYYCGGYYIDQEGQTHSGDCPPKTFTGARSGDSNDKRTIGFTPSYSPCNGASVMRIRSGTTGQWSGWSVHPAAQRCVPSGMTAQPGTCTPAAGLSLNCAVQQSYSTQYQIAYSTVPTPLQSTSTSRCRPPQSGGCSYGNTTYVQSYPCYSPDAATVGAMWGGPSPGCGCWTVSWGVILRADLCPTVEVGVMCPDGNVVKTGGGNQCGCPQTKYVSTVRTEFKRNDCKSPPTAT